MNRKQPMEYRLGPAEQEGSHAYRGAGGSVKRRPSRVSMPKGLSQVRPKVQGP